MRAWYPYHISETESIQEFDPNLGEIIHFAAYYEYLFAVVSTSIDV